MATTPLPPTPLVEALAALWRWQPPGPNNLFADPAFGHLRDTCQRLYPSAGSKSGLTFALDTALRNLGLPCGLVDRNRDLALSPEVAATQLDAAFRRTVSSRVHLCPLDHADELPAVTFGPNQVRRFSASDLDDLVDPARLQVFDPDWRFDSRRFSEFTWLVVREDVELEGKPGARAVPELLIDLSKDFGEIEPHRRRFPVAVERALFACLLPSWDEWVQYSDLDWRGFLVPWVYTLDDDIFARPAKPPSPDTLSWEPDILTTADGAEIETERPIVMPLSDFALDLALWLNDSRWAELQTALESPFMGHPVPHFFCSRVPGRGDR